MAKAAFAVKALCKSVIQSTACPYCGSHETRLMERKHIVLQLRKCERCKLQFRFPKDNPAENRSFYQKAYRESTVTDLPAASEIPRHIANRFRDVGRDLTIHLKTIQGIASGRGKILDYGCSWGYCVYQFREAGYEASGFEISRSRVEYGREMLRVDLKDAVESFPDAAFDIIYSAHVLEHISDPEPSFRQFRRLLKPGGHLFIYVPNGGGADARTSGVRWGPMIGEKHVLALTAEFFYANLPKYGFQVQFASAPYAAPPEEFAAALLEGEELLVSGIREAQ